LPIQPDFNGAKFDVAKGSRVNVFLEDIDGKEGVELTTD
jgi:pyrimidine operon attenuation protein/uracil phosphoribosyltransferase